MKILGLSFDYHDAAAALVIDGKVVAACQEERLSRVKHDGSFPTNAIKACLKIAGITAAELDHVAYYEQPLEKFDRIVVSARAAKGDGKTHMEAVVRNWLYFGKFEVRDRIASALGIETTRVSFVPHHLSHAASAFFCSNFEEAAVVTLDGVGEFETATVSHGVGKRIIRKTASHYPHSVGLFYSAMTAFLGFEVNEGEYKVMGMAGFGQPTMVDLIRRMVRWDGSHFELDQSYFDFFAATETHFRPKMVELLGQPRMPEASFAPADDADSRHYADIAASVQRVTEEIILSYVDAATRLVGIKRVAMAGGVALNSLANGRIQRELGVELYVQPSAGDAGGALGAALAAHCQIPNTHRPAPLLSAYLGQSFTNADAVAALKAAGMESYEILPDLETTCRRTAELLRDGAVIGWFQGRFEWGPRALGARSILANPALPDMQRTINEKIKFREPFRPFAPAVLAEKASRYFEIESERSELDPESFMLSVAQVRSDARADIPAVTHVDGTARVQLVWERSDSAFRRLLEHFDTLTGLPVLLNTSFNRRGEPIVSSPADALKTFTWSGLDCLVMGNVLVHKEFF